MDQLLVKLLDGQNDGGQCFVPEITRTAGGESLDCQDWKSNLGKRDAPCSGIQLFSFVIRYS